MKRYRYLTSFIVLTTLILLGVFFLKLNSAFIKHACFVQNMDEEFGVHRDFSDKKKLLKQRHPLMPHLRRQYLPFSYSISNDLHKRTDLLQQSSNSLVHLRQDAEHTQKRLFFFLKEFEASHQGVRLFIPKTKSLDTIQHLLATRWEGDASRITDYARATIAFPTLKMMYEGLEEIKKSGLMILRIDDHFQAPCLGGYRDITIIFRDFVNGHIGEIQLNTHKIMDFKTSLGTDLFHVIRALMAVPSLKQRSLSESEQTCLEILFAMEKNGYDKAYEDSQEEHSLYCSQKKMAIYSGSFDPPTKAHREIIVKTLEQGRFNQLIIYINRFGKKHYQASVEDRKKMLEIMLQDVRDKVSISIQSQSDKRIDFRKIRGLDSQLTLVIGEDSFQKRLSLPQAQLAECDKLLIIPRGAKSKILRDKNSRNIEIICLENMDTISSTAAKEKLMKGELAEKELEPAVLSYIIENNLYSIGGKDECAKR